MVTSGALAVIARVASVRLVAWHCRGSSMIAHSDSSVMVRKLPIDGAESMARTASGAGSSPLVVLLIAVALMGERPEPWTYLGSGLIVGGVMVLSTEHRLAELPERGNQPFGRAFILAAAATLLFAVAAALRKVGVIRVPSLSVALCAASIGVLGATLFLHRFLPEGNRIRFTRQRAGWFTAWAITLRI